MSADERGAKFQQRLVNLSRETRGIVQEAIGQVRFPAPPHYRVTELIDRTLRRLQRKARSPLEAILGVALIREFAGRRILAWDGRLLQEEPSIIERWIADVSDVPRVDLRVNRGMARCVFDFTLEGFGCHMAIECDSETWHRGRQADRDRRKDDLVAQWGWRLVRLESARILKDAGGCALEIVHALVGV